MRKGRYKKNLMLEKECKEFALQFEPVVKTLASRYSQEALSDCEFVAEYLLKALQLLKPKDWKGARRLDFEPQCALDFFKAYSFRGIPLSANRTLLAWQQGIYQLQLFFHVPSTETVLALQSQGIRCVTCVTDRASLSNYVMGERDPISFTLHDLIHADHFLSDPQQTQVQIGFSRWMQEIWNQPEMQNLLVKESFAAQFEYACADMNSHGAHLVKYLKAIFCQADNEELLLNLAKRCELSREFLVALQFLNSEKETIEHLSSLQTELFLKGATARQNQEHHSVAARVFVPAGVVAG